MSQPLFDLLTREHGLLPLESEMADIARVVLKHDGLSPNDRAILIAILTGGFQEACAGTSSRHPEIAAAISRLILAFQPNP